MASFPLVPYANRIAYGRFEWDGASHQLPPNFGDHPHSIHGFGWQTAWTAAEATDTYCVFVHEHLGAEGWPWAYRAEQRVSLYGSSLALTLTVTNTGDAPMPVGLGFHPYFAADADTRLQFSASGVWLSSPDMLPERAAPADTFGDWSSPAAILGESLIDNIYAGWDGSATVLRGDGVRLILKGENAGWLHVYRPPGERFFCLEPVSHMPDAINRGGMRTIAPGESASIGMTLIVERGDQALSQSPSFP